MAGIEQEDTPMKEEVKSSKTEDSGIEYKGCYFFATYFSLLSKFIIISYIVDTMSQEIARLKKELFLLKSERQSKFIIS